MRSISSLVLGLFAALLVSAALAQDYPTRPVRIIVPYAPGGLNDIAARILGNKLSEIWKESVIIDNRAGGAGIIGTNAAAKSSPDGYTLLSVSNAHAVAAAIYAKVAILALVIWFLQWRPTGFFPAKGRAAEGA